MSTRPWEFHRAVAEACGQWIVFTDDDVTVDRMFLTAIASTIANTHSTCVGGRIILDYPVERPKWLADRTDYIFGRVDLGSHDVPFRTPVVPLGPSFGIKMEMFQTYGLFNEQLGLSGSANQIRRGEEVEFVERILRGGETVYCSANSVVHHRVNPSHLHKEWYLDRFWYGGRQLHKNTRSLSAARVGSALKFCAAVALRSLGIVTRSAALEFYGRCKAVYFGAAAFGQAQRDQSGELSGDVRIDPFGPTSESR